MVAELGELLPTLFRCTCVEVWAELLFPAQRWPPSLPGTGVSFVGHVQMQA